MNILKINREASIVIPVDSPKTANIYDTLKPLENILDPDETMILGSAAAFLYGVELDPYDPVRGVPIERPSDLDLASTAVQMERVFRQGLATPKDTHSRAQTILKLNKLSTPMSVDLITRFRDGRDNMLAFDRRFRERLHESSRSLEGSPFRIASPDLLFAELRTNRDDPKINQDLNSFNKRFPTRRSRTS